MHATYSEPVGTFAVLRDRFRTQWRHAGFFAAVGMMLKLAAQVCLTPYYRATLGKRTFRFQGKDHRYFCHWYNTTFDNERMIEIALAIDLLQANEGKHILEVGNVLSHYTDVPRDVLDKYEKGEGVIHEDIADYQPDMKYDLVISISTMEHVGFDEDPKDPDKFMRAMRNIETMLAPGGRIFISIPVAYNPDAVQALCNAKDKYALVFFDRTAKTEWKECTMEEALRKDFGKPYTFANAMIFCLNAI